MRVGCGGAGATPPSECLWCGQTSKPNPYVLPLKNGRKTFCSEACLFEFRKGACVQCGDTIRGSPVRITSNMVVKDFCSDKCLGKYQKKDSSPKEKDKVVKTGQGQGRPSLATKSPVYGTPTSLTSSKAVQNSFSWDDYLAETGSVAAPHKCFKQVPVVWLHSRSTGSVPLAVQ